MSSQVSSTPLPTAPARISWARIVGGAVLLEVLLVALLTPIGLVFGSPFLEGSTDTTVFLVAIPAGCFVFAAIVSGRWTTFAWKLSEGWWTRPGSNR